MSGVANEVVDYMLFIDETKLTDRVRGASGFAERFSAAGPRDRKGRSLHELDLNRRLMKYPCSYLIYSAAFDQLPPGARDPIYRRMWEILSGNERQARYRSALSLADRRAIVEILRDTKPGLPCVFRRRHKVDIRHGCNGSLSRPTARPPPEAGDGGRHAGPTGRSRAACCRKSTPRWDA